jgi:membrane-bound lytic murein transglycosylase F
MKTLKISYAFYILILLMGVSSCTSESENTYGDQSKIIITPEDVSIAGLYNSSPEINKDLNEIIKDGVLKVVMTNSSTSYFIYKGQAMGYEFELLNRLADYLKLELEIIIAKDNDDLFRQLFIGNADLIAHGLAVTTPREKYAGFTDYLVLSHQVLVQKKPDNWREMKLHEIQQSLISDPVELIGDTVSVRDNSSYMHRLGNLIEEIGGSIFTDTLDSGLETDEIIRMVVTGDIKYTIADNHIASINESYYPELDINTPISFSQRIAWATRKNSIDLLSAINDWLESIKRTPDYNMIYQKYFKNTRDFRKRIDSEFYSLNKGKISIYDDLIKKNAESLGWDWRLVSSLVYQESQFNPQAESWAEAHGLMQLMPATAEELGVVDRSDPEESIRGGTKYLRQLWERWDNIPDSLQRIKFAMASYNCGYYHIVDARNLAGRDQFNENEWDENVELYILKLSKSEYFNDPLVKYGYARGIEPYTYVKEIFERFDHYNKFISY